LSYARRLIVALSAVCLIAALAAPTAGAAGKHSSSKASKAFSAKKSAKRSARAIKQTRAQSAQSRRRLARSIRTINRRSLSNRRRIRTLTTNLTTVGNELRAAIAGGDKTIDDKINGIVATVAPVLGQLGQGLLDLRAALEGPIAQAFTDIEAGFTDVENGFIEVEGALTDIGDFLGSSKYGILQLAVEDNEFGATDDADTSPDAIPGCFYVTENMSDEVQPATLHGQCNTTGADAGTQLFFLAGIRDNENDGGSSTSPAGVAGIIAYDQRASDGTQVGAGGTSATASAFGPVVPIPTGSPVTSETEVTFPFGPISTDLPNMVSIADDLPADEWTGAPDPPVVVTGGNIVSFTARFIDVTADAEDPQA